jgi:tubulin polyglutamylase TTLL6/13
LKHIDRIRNEENGLPTSDYIWQEIKEICVKTLLAGIHHIEHLYRSSKPADLENSLCFQIFGMDVMLDQYGKPWLLEVNHSPSFMTDSPLDYNIKKNVLRDTLHMLNLS